MEGRWTITKRNDDVRFIGGPGAQEVPVVPCDDAAIERAARALSAGMEPTAIEREQAVAVLRAAGETP